MKIEELSAAAGSMIDRLKQDQKENTTDQAKVLIKRLRDTRQFELLGDLATTFSKYAHDPEVLVCQAQGLIETGGAVKARDLLGEVAAKVPGTSEQFVEAKGLQAAPGSKPFSRPKTRTAIRLARLSRTR